MVVILVLNAAIASVPNMQIKSLEIKKIDTSNYDIRDFIDLDNSSFGEVNDLICSILECYSSSISTELLDILTTESEKNLNYYRTECRVIEKEATSTRTFKTLETF